MKTSFLLWNDGQKWQESDIYQWQDFVDAVKMMAKEGIAGKRFYLGDSSPNGINYGLTNIAAFLGQSKQETIQYNACDENNWDTSPAASNACGQLNQSYQDYICTGKQEGMECPLDSEMEIIAVTNAHWYGAPGPLFCGPKEKTGLTPKWNNGGWCNPSTSPSLNDPSKVWPLNNWTWDKYFNEVVSPGESTENCYAYYGQKSGYWKFCGDEGCPNSTGRTDVENCCWWGRGVIQTTGRCNFGLLNYYLGTGKTRTKTNPDASQNLYKDINFCKDPESICNSTEYPSLKWIDSLFYWVTSVQEYQGEGTQEWSFYDSLTSWVDDGMQNPSSDADGTFIHSVSGIVNRGCPHPPCGSGPLDAGPERAKNFSDALEILEKGNN